MPFTDIHDLNPHSNTFIKWNALPPPHAPETQ
nr:MAG TPA: Protein of unknown function (DUF3750) [Caudoviricetes sp.]